MDLVHKCKGKRIVYVLACEPCPETGNEIRYIGQTRDCEKRICQHCGIQNGGAKWTESHPPIDVLSVRVVETEEEAAAMEVMLFQLHAAKIGYGFCRGARWNMNGPMQRPPPGFTEEHVSPPNTPPSPLPCPRLITGKEEFKYLAGLK